MSDFIIKADQELREQRSKARAIEATTPAEALLSDAIKTVASRRTNYGPPLEHFRRTVGMINALFAHKLREPFTEQDWAQIMLCDKMARHQQRPIADNPLDAAGYAACWAEAMGNVS